MEGHYRFDLAPRAAARFGFGAIRAPSGVFPGIDRSTMSPPADP